MKRIYLSGSESGRPQIIRWEDEGEEENIKNKYFNTYNLCEYKNVWALLLLINIPQFTMKHLSK